MIDGDTRLVGIVGNPLSHSLSPFFQNYLLARAGLRMRYVPFPVARPERLEAALRGLAAAGVVGVNVTVPHKVAAARLCDRLSPDAKAAGAANAIAFARDGSLEGENTDIEGFLAPIDEAGVDVAGRGALVLGAGGAARAVALALARRGGIVSISARDRTRAAALAASVESATKGHLDFVPWEERHAAFDCSALVVNATPAGQHPDAEACPLDPERTRTRPDQTLYDLVYNPLRTRFLELAATAGARAIDGLHMLIRQGVLALELWTGAHIRPYAAEARQRSIEELERRRAAPR